MAVILLLLSNIGAELLEFTRGRETDNDGKVSLKMFRAVPCLLRECRLMLTSITNRYKFNAIGNLAGTWTFSQ